MRILDKKNIGEECTISTGYTQVVFKKLKFSDKKIFSSGKTKGKKQDKYLEVIKEVPNQSFIYRDKSDIEMASFKDRG
ncbi:hypothetical protein [Holospora curviuscula]|uniref:Uncharacterized protein n=1 Tax=Holospora curviuscula TaxID=1082868 RepID=A0A2S5R9S5_9PROT|nr:hypothetical protein [Holospora curviuscula]PPE03885.1 hypothetical protein HCUR_00665 [Holospora curviuscula]